MKKKTNDTIVISLIILVLVIITVLVSAVLLNKELRSYTETDGKITYKIIGNNAEIIKYNNSDKLKDIVIPDEYKGAKITALGDELFKDDKNIKNVTLGKNIKSIGKRAFAGCDNLADVKFNNVESIGEEAFMGDRNLTYYTIPKTLKSIGTRAFKSTNSSQVAYEHDDNYYINSSLTSIGEYAFEDSRMEFVVIPASLKSIGKRAFSKMPSLRYVFFYDGVESIGEEAFMDTFAGYSGRIYTYDKVKAEQNKNDSILVEMLKYSSNIDVFPSTLKTIGNRAFKNSSTSKMYSFDNITFGKNIMSIGDEAFRGGSFRSIAFANPDTTLGKYAFSRVSSSSGSSGVQVELPANLTIINDGLFYGTCIYNKLVIPKNVETIGKAAFSATGVNGYNNNVTLDFTGSKAGKKYKYVNDNFRGLMSLDGSILYTAFGQNDIVVPSTVTTIEAYAFSTPDSDNYAGNSGTVVLPSSVKMVKARAFTDSKYRLIDLNHNGADEIIMDVDAFRKESISDEVYVIRVNKGANALNVLQNIFKNEYNVSVSQKA